jgi:predicted DNA-binding protein YlxM (UPF0122 family)
MAKCELTDKQILSLYEQDFTLTLIARAAGVSRQAIQQRLRKLGVTPRSQSEWARKGRE